MENLELLIKQLCEYKDETPWLEFKHNNYDPKLIGKDISALANGATISGRDISYFIWGVDNVSHEIIGTDKNLENLKVGNQELQNWLRDLLTPNADFEYYCLHIDGKQVGILLVHGAVITPVAFKKIEYVRVGSYTRKLMDEPALQSRLWLQLHSKNYEDMLAREDLTLKDVVNLLEYGVYFDLTKQQQPLNAEGILHYLVQEKIVKCQDNGMYAITNMGALLFAKKLSDFSSVQRKAVRIVVYRGTNRLEMLKNIEIERGYAAGFEEMMQYIEALLPSQERINGAIREKVSTYPMLAVREIIANALIHQDIISKGTGPRKIKYGHVICMLVLCSCKDNI